MTTAEIYQPCFRYMIVDDGLVHLKGIQHLVNKALTELERPFICDMVESGARAIEMCAQNTYHFVIMDQNMPQMSGAEATKMILNSKPDIYIIGCTASTDPKDIQDCIDAGMKKVLPKDYKQVAEFVKRIVPGMMAEHA
ncbi:MAG: response regulator [Verrucomicrobia bacterium]|nr:response regulator [Verrucomicrobiota bacterium]